MKNLDLLRNKNHLNEFTQSLRILSEGSGYREVTVTLRNDSITKVIYEPSFSSFQQPPRFRTRDWDHVWNADGSSQADPSYDIISFGE